MKLHLRPNDRLRKESIDVHEYVRDVIATWKPDVIHCNGNRDGRHFVRCGHPACRS